MIFLSFIGIILQLFITSTESQPFQSKYCQLKNDTAIVCKKHLPNLTLQKNVTTVELLNIDWEKLSIDKIIEKFPYAENVSVDGRTILKVIPPSVPNRIKVLQLKNLKLLNVSHDFVDHFSHLQELSLEGNKLQSLHTNFSFGQLKRLYLFANRWNCSKDLTWVLKLPQEIIPNFEDLICHGDPYSGIPLLSVANFLRNVKEDCPHSCNCSLTMVVQNPETDKIEPIIEVNCRNRGLTELPRLLPKQTKILHLEDNNIEDLSLIREIHNYRSVEDLYLDGNRIHSIEVLEGAYWLTRFRVFSLAGNNLAEVPSYALDNALSQNTKNMPNAVRITLGGNPWRCDCSFTPVFQEFLQKYAPQIQDLSDIKCSYVEGDENSLLPIVYLSRVSLCRLPSEYSVQEALDLLIAILGFLIIFVLGKLAYDYYHFKKTGTLPWIVTKIP